MKISENKLVTLQYQLYVKAETGEKELMEETSADQPLVFFYGMGMMLPKFEEHLSGKAVGDTFDFMIPAEEAYGQYEEENIVDLPRNIFEVEGQIDTEAIFPGAIVPLVDSEGQRINAEVVEVLDNAVKVDFNHPLAGEDLYFTGTVENVTEPTEEELKAMQGGCGSCGCGGCDSDEKDGCGSGCCH